MLGKLLLSVSLASWRLEVLVVNFRFTEHNCDRLKMVSMMMLVMMMMMMSSAGKDGRKRKNKKKAVNTRTKAGHVTNMDVFIDHVGIIIIITAIIVIVIIQGVPIKVRPWLINNISSTNES